MRGHHPGTLCNAFRSTNDMKETDAPFTPATIVDLLRWRACHQRDRQAYTFLTDGEHKEEHLTYQDLDRQARAIGALLQQAGVAGERALLLYPPGLGYLTAFFGCLYAGVTAVPAYPPQPARLSRTLPRLEAMASDAQAAVILTTSTIAVMGKVLLTRNHSFRGIRWLTTNRLARRLEEQWHDPSVDQDTLAFLQYTSGSTAQPRGVMLSHNNLMHNLAFIHQCFDLSPESQGVIWLPPYHDMGLIGGILQPLYGGFPVVLMSPVAFLQNPLRWLQAVSHYGATTSGGPNFAYDLCVRKSTPAQRASLDLRRWKVAFNGAEPIRPDTLERFAAAFAPCGFRREAFYPCYGLAEATLIVSGGAAPEPPIVRTFRGAALENNRVSETPADQDGARALVGCGRSLEDQQVVIVHPETLTRCSPDQVGEIWVAGPSVAQGYWHRPDETEHTFGAFLADTGAGPFLRTGDLGCIRDGELFVTGRLKDLIIIRGRNLYPQDIELTVERCDPALRPGHGAAFVVEVDGEEQLVVVQEVQRHYRNTSHDTVIEAIRRAVAEEHDVHLSAVALIKAGSIPKTSSSKLQRSACRSAFLNDSLPVVAKSILADATVIESDAPMTRERLLALQPREQQAALAATLQTQLGQIMRLDPLQIDPQQPVSALGIDSLTAVELQTSFEAQLGVVLPITSLLQALSIAELATQILAALTDPTSATPDRIPAQETHGVHPLSYGQRALWFLHQLTPTSAAYNIANAVCIRSELDIPALRRAFQMLIDRHASLRTTFTTIHGEPVQRVVESQDVSFQEEDASAWSDIEMHARLVADAHHPFDLERGPLLRLSLFRRSRHDHILLLVVHHLVADLWSLAGLMHELDVLYPAAKDGTESPLPPLALRYTDYVRWQTERLAGPQGEQLWTYWQQQLAGELPTLNLPADRPRPPLQTYRGAAHTFRLNRHLTRQLRELAQAEGTTLYTLLLAAFQTLLHRYTGQDEILVGSPTAGRSHAGLDNLVGYFVNPVVLHANLSAQPTFRAFLRQVRSTVLAALEHQDYPFALLVERLQLQRDLSHSPLFQTMFVWEKPHRFEALSKLILGASEARVILGGLALEALALEQQVTQFDLTLMVVETGEELTAALQYSTDLFDGARIARMAAHFQTLLAGLVAAPDTPIAHLPLLPAAERQQLLVTWNATTTPAPPPTCLPNLVTTQAARTPDACAVVADDGCLTYRDLDQRATQLAHYLRALGVGPEVRVGVALPRSAALVVGVLAILKAGGAYVPLDLRYPAERLAFMLHDAQAPVLLTTTDSGLLPAALGATQVVDLAADWPTIAQQPTTPLASGVIPDNLAYVIYTSGSTGTPKGVEIPHAGLSNLVAWHQATYQVTPADRATLVAGTAFDASVWELWPYLSAGASLYIPDETTRAVPALLLRWIRTHGITLCFLPTPLAEALLAEPALDGLALRVMLTGGDVLHPVRRALPFALVNHYGPTEYSVVTTWAPVVTGPAADTAPSIGRPIANTQVYVLDRQRQPVPIGVPGELYISGAGLARGYLNQPVLTAERFLPAPAALAPTTRLYRTGDLVRYRPDGNLEFLGRLDEQVKVRGFRIELGEIEAVLQQHPQVRETVVVVQEEPPGHKRLVAYVVLRPLSTGMEPSSESGATALSHNGPWTTVLRDFLRQRVPEYMVPSAFVFLDALPLTPNGKVDRHALPRPEQMHDELATTFVAPHTTAEQALTEIWARVLQRERVGIHHNFFDLGGHSLLATEVIAAVRDAFRVEVPLRHLFENPTIAGLAEVIEQAHCSGAGPQRQTIVPITREAHRVKLSDLTRQAETIQIEGRL
jgi:amino acid adenylation domain-containing protein